MEKKNNFMLVMIVILSISLLGAVSFIVYDKVIKKDEGTNTVTKTTNNDQTNNSSDTTDKTTNTELLENNKVYNYKLSERKILQAITYSGCSSVISVISDKNGDVYLTAYQTTSDCKPTDVEKSNIDKIINQMVETKIDGLELEDGSSSIKSIKLDVYNVLSMYVSNFGQTMNEYIFFVKDNGKISYLRTNDIYEKGEVNIKDISEINNVVSIVSNSYSLGAYAITLDGKEIELTNYLDEFNR